MFEREKGHVEPFSRNKLLLSVYESCKHKKDALEDAEALTDTIVNRLVPTAKQSVITRGDVCTVAKHVLRRYDLAAATHFTAYHSIN
jgi:transcriptional regulator NrdR family protein